VFVGEPTIVQVYTIWKCSRLHFTNISGSHLKFHAYWKNRH